MKTLIAGLFAVCSALVGAGVVIGQDSPPAVRDVSWREARPTRWIDGDTVDATINLGFQGFDLTSGSRLRLLYVDTPELSGTTRARGLEARAYAESWIVNRCGEDQEATWPVHVSIKGRDSFGRLLTVIACKTQPYTLNQDLLDAGLAVPYE